tara:strand:- start:1197 stop:1562 length:366 start_codon:yes stop_codon:yes gene_type:complete
MKFYDSTNRIDAAIERQQGRIDKLIESGVDLRGNPITASLENLDQTMALTVKDHADFQDQQSRAAAMGKLNTDEALTVYNALGEWHNDLNGGWQDGVSLASKVVITQLIGELLSKTLSKAS